MFTYRARSQFFHLGRPWESRLAELPTRRKPESSLPGPDPARTRTARASGRACNVNTESAPKVGGIAGHFRLGGSASQPASWLAGHFNELMQNKHFYYYCFVARCSMLGRLI